MYLIIDNYDSFTFNLYQMLAINSQNIKVFRNDEITVSEIINLNPKGIIISPGPGKPENAGVCLDIIKNIDKQIPILGICLGHQAIALAFGGRVERSNKPIHGKSSLIFHNRSILFNKVHLPFEAARYHSLVVKKITKELNIDAEDNEGNIMAISHKEYPIYGLQFHPESILTKEGETIIKNFVGICDAKSLY